MNWLLRLIRTLGKRKHLREEMDKQWDSAATPKHPLPLDPANDPWRS